MKRIVTCTLLLLCAAVFSAQTSYVLLSGDGIEFRKEQLEGRITVCFYETYKTMNVNETVKKNLEGLMNGLNDDRKNFVQILGVTDCTEAKWPFVALWKKGLIAVSEQYKQTIYGDWKGEMKQDLLLNLENPHLIIFNPQGAIVYHIQSAISPEDEKVIVQTLENLFREQNL